ncbi:hypothetical protein MJD09_03365 [bacterium]|nr:hypothetical protein [bacterium]
MNKEEIDHPGERNYHYNERISLHDFKSSGDLKQEIRNVISAWHKAHYQVDSMFSRGPYIYLVFKGEVQNEIA